MDRSLMPLDAATEANIKTWLEGPYDEATRNEIRRLQKEDPEQLIDSFYRSLDFGTGGLRGKMGVGPNRMNLYTVRAATQGLASYIRQHTSQPSCLISYDSRHHSREFAEETARVLAGNGIHVYLYKELRPVPLVSFGVRYKECTAGVMITASHNPPDYNGYKVYWSDGCQVLPPHDRGIMDEVHADHPIQMVPYPHPLIEEIDHEIDQAYCRVIRNWQCYPQDNHAYGSRLSIVYTSLHGAGITMVPQALADWGFTHVSLVASQCVPDGSFPTAPSPNPEEQAALQLGIEQLQKEQADILLGTDPDTDRIGVVVLHDGKPVVLNGNEVACLCAEHLCRALRKQGAMPPKPTFIKTIVTTELFREIAEQNEAVCVDVLTGFKYIGQKMEEWSHEPHSPHYLFGGEESYGYLLGTHARDKDAIVAAVLIAEMALQMKLLGKTLMDLLFEIYARYGVFRERLATLLFEGKKGAEQMNRMMSLLRQHPPRKIGGVEVVSLEDYQTHRKTHFPSGHWEPLLLPTSNVLRFWLADGSKVVVRPSGTEPKLKLYCGVVQHRHTHIEDSIAACDQRLDELLAQLKEGITEERWG